MIFLVLVSLAQSPQLAESARKQALGCAEKAQDACKQLCESLDLWLMTGPDTDKPQEHADAMAKAWPKPARCAAAVQLWRGKAKVAQPAFVRAYEAMEANDDDRALAAAGAMLAFRSLGNNVDGKVWALKFLEAIGDFDNVRGHDAAGALLIARGLAGKK